MFSFMVCGERLANRDKQKQAVIEYKPSRFTHLRSNLLMTCQPLVVQLVSK